MMVVPRELKDLESVYRDSAFENDASYWFSYINDAGHILHAFRDGLLLLADETNKALYSEVYAISLIVPDVATPDGCGIKITGRDGDVIFAVDTKHGERFLDVFGIHRALQRQLYISKRDYGDFGGTA